MGDVSCFEVMRFITKNPSPESLLSVDRFQDQKRVKPVPTS